MIDGWQMIMCRFAVAFAFSSLSALALESALFPFPKEGQILWLWLGQLLEDDRCVVLTLVLLCCFRFFVSILISIFVFVVIADYCFHLSCHLCLCFSWLLFSPVPSFLFSFLFTCCSPVWCVGDRDDSSIWWKMLSLSAVLSIFTSTVGRRL